MRKTAKQKTTVRHGGYDNSKSCLPAASTIINRSTYY